jgi:hypothetical protein
MFLQALRRLRVHGIVMPRRTTHELKHVRATLFAALYALGWTKPQIAEAFGCNQQRVRILITLTDVADMKKTADIFRDIPQVIDEMTSA